MRVRKSYLCTFISLSLSQAAWADRPEESLTVWSSSVPAATTSILGQETIRSLDRQDVAHALSAVPGVVLQKSGGRNELQVKIRGFDGRQVPVFFDGVPIYVPYDGNLDLGRFLTSDVASVEVAKSYSSLLQGPNQMGGAVNITTPRPNKPLEASVGYRQGWSRSEDSAYDTHASLGVSNELGYIQLSGSRLKRDFLALPHGSNNPVAGEDGKMANSASDDKRGIFKLGFTPRGNDEYAFTWIKQDGEKQNPPYAGTSTQKSRYWQWPEYDKESYYYQGTTHLGDRFTLKSRLYHDTFKNTLMMYNSLADLQHKTGSYSHYSDYSTGAGLQLSTDIHESDQLSFAVNWKDDIHREKSAINGPYDRYQDRTWSLASEYQWQAAENVDIVAGVSYDWRNSIEGMKHEKNDSVTRYDGNKQDAFNWQSMARYHFANDDTLALSFSDRTRFPTLKERYTTSKPAKDQIALVNPQLKPERARSVDLTWNGHLIGSWAYEVSAYYNRVSDAIMSIAIDDDTVQNQNSGRVDYRGLDLGIKGSPFAVLDVGLSYGLIHAETKRQETGKVTDLPNQTLTAWLTLKPTEPLQITLSEEARSSSYSSSDGKQKAPGFAITHLRADYAIGRGFSVNASVNNLFDSHYYYSEGFIEEGRNFWAGVEYRF